MHVALVGAHALPGEPSKGGVERVVQVLRRKLAERMQVSLVVPGARQGLRTTDEYGEITYLKRSAGPGFLTYWSWSSLAVYQEIERMNPDLVHVQGVAGDALFWPVGKKPRKRPIIFTAHGVLEVDIVHTAGEDVLRRITVPARAALIGTVERKSRDRYDEVIAINEYVLEAMPDVAGLRYHLIPNPVDDLFFQAPRAPRSPDGVYHMLQVGVVSPLKNILASIEIAGELIRRGTPVHLHVLGPIVDVKYHQHCLRQAAKLGLDNVVTFHGNATRAEVAAWMDRSDLLLLISKQEMAPMVVAEAHCRGLPVAVPRAFGLRSMVSEGVNGIFLDGPDVTDDAARVRRLLEVGLDRERIRSAATAHYAVDGIIDRTLDVYWEALEMSLRVAGHLAEV